jgi:alpha-D-xyloside xylohydrolase
LQYDSLNPLGEALYGLGANQTSFMNMKGKDADLFQYNTMAVVPFIVSNRNYGILWDNNSRTKFGDVREWAELSALKLYNREGRRRSYGSVRRQEKCQKDIYDP